MNKLHPSKNPAVPSFDDKYLNDGDSKHIIEEFPVDIAPPYWVQLIRNILNGTAPYYSEETAKDALKNFNEIYSDYLGLSDENFELKTTPWPEWYAEALKEVRHYSGYDGYDDAEYGPDLVEEIREALHELSSDADIYRKHYEDLKIV